MSRRHVIDIATRRNNGKSKTGSSRPAIEAATGQADAPAGAVVSIGTPARIGAALRAVRRDLPVAVLEAHLHDLRTCGDADDLSVKLVGQWLEERVRATAVTTAKPTAVARQGGSQPSDDGGSRRRRKVPGKRRAAKPADPCRGGDA